MAEDKAPHTEEQQTKPRRWRPWRLTRRQVLWAPGTLVALVTIALLVVNLDAVKWEDLSRERIKSVALLIGIAVAVTTLIVLLAIGGASLGWTGFGDKTFWDWLQLLSSLAIPVVLATAGLWFTAQQDQRQEKIEDQRAKSERQLEEQRAQDEALQAYLDQMSTLMLDTDQDLRNADADSEVQTLARARTAAVIQRLDADRNQNVIRFLKEANLTGNLTGDGQSSISLLTAADLQGARLEGVDLSTIDLLMADLSGANLSEADLFMADLSGTDLSGADLSGTEGVTERELEQQVTPLSLQGATMPDGTVRPERYVTRKFEPALSFTLSDEEWKQYLPETPNLISFSDPGERRIGSTSSNPSMFSTRATQANG